MPNNKFYETNSLSLDITNKLSEYINLKEVYGARSIYPEEITECGRKIFYRTSECKDDITKLTKMEIRSNKIAISKWIKFLNEVKGFRVLDKDVLASDHRFNMVSFIDCVVEFEDYDSTQVVFCIKPISSTDFQYVVDNGPFRKDIIRANVDLWLIELGKCILLYENRDTFEFITFYIEPSVPIRNSIRKKAKMLVDCRVKGEIPKRPYKNSDSKECQSCSFKNTCWE